VLEILAKYHEDWLNIAKQVGSKFPNDLVQDFYIAVSKTDEHKLIQNNAPNYAYIWVTLRNMSCKEKVTNFEQLPFELPDNVEIYDHSKDELIDNTQKVIQTFNDYEKRLLDIHINSGISGNKLAKATGINKYSIYRTIKKCKQKIKDEVKG